MNTLTPEEKQNLMADMRSYDESLSGRAEMDLASIFVYISLPIPANMGSVNMSIIAVVPTPPYLQNLNLSPYVIAIFPIQTVSCFQESAYFQADGFPHLPVQIDNVLS